MTSIELVLEFLTTPWGRGIALVATTAIGIALAVQGGGALSTKEAPRGVLCLEFAYTADKASMITDSWGAKGVKDKAFWQIILDFPFIIAYAALIMAIALRCQQAAAGIDWLEQAARFAFYAGPIAGLLDCIENVGMLITLSGAHSDAVAFVTAACAFVKFALIVATILVLCATFVFT